MNILDLASLPISVVALAVSIYAARQSSQYRRGDRYVEAARLAAECGQRIADIVSRCESLRPEWVAILSARGMFQSSVHQQIDLTIDSLAQDANSLRPRLGELSNGLDDLRNREIDRRLVELSSLKLAVDGLESRLQDSERKCKESRDNYNSMRR